MGKKSTAKRRQFMVIPMFINMQYLQKKKKNDVNCLVSRVSLKRVYNIANNQSFIFYCVACYINVIYMTWRLDSGMRGFSNLFYNQNVTNRHRVGIQNAIEKIERERNL